MKFTKMHGCGNDYIYINCLEEQIENSSELAKKLSDRHFGIGGDGIVLILKSEVADFRMRMFNSDGSEAEMCGNAVRCVGKFIYDYKISGKKKLYIETLAGIKVLELILENGEVVKVKVDMGEPILGAEKIPVLSDKNIAIDEEIEYEGKIYKFTCVSMGNPHAVTYVDDVENMDIEKIGRFIESHNKFPKKVNVEFVQVVNGEVLKMRVWERGAGETLACGTGACATVVTSILKNICKRQVTVELLGGELMIEWNEKDNRVYMIGEVVKVFEGII